MKLRDTDLGDGQLAAIARDLYEATSSKPMLPWHAAPAPLLPYLDFVYGAAGEPLEVGHTYQPEPQPLVNTGTCVVGFSGGKDSMATALLAQAAGYDPVLYHVTGLNRAWPDEVRYAREAAQVAGLPLVEVAVHPEGAKTGVPEPATKNQIIMAGMVEWALANGRGPAFSMGMVIEDRLLGGHPLSYIHDSVDAGELFGLYLEAAAPGWVGPLYLRGIAESNAVVAGHSRELLYACHGCMAQMRFRPGYRKAAEAKYGVRLLPGRCGVSCPKCASEYCLLWHLGALEPVEANEAMYQAARAYLGSHPLYDASTRPDLHGLKPAQLADRYLEPELTRVLLEARTEPWPMAKYPLSQPAPAPAPAQAPPQWGKDGPTVGQVITIAGTDIQARWTGSSWEKLPDATPDA